MSRNAAHATRGRVVHHAAKHVHVRSFAGPAERCALLGGRNTPAQRLRRREHRLVHLEGTKDLLPHELVERLPAHAADDVAEKQEVDVAVDEPLAR